MHFCINLKKNNPLIDLNMKKLSIVIALLFSLLYPPSYSFTIEEAPRISDKEIIERLTRLAEGQKGMEKSLRAEIRANAEAIRQLREDMNTQFGRIDSQFGRMDSQFDRIDSQFDRIVQIMLGILGAFVLLFGGTIWFALWDRRSMIRPFEDKVKVIEDEIAKNRSKLHSLIESLRSLSNTDQNIAKVLKKFNLL